MKSIWLIAAACLAFGASPALAEKNEPAVPANDPGQWVTPDDYPSYSLYEDEEGTTKFVLRVGKDGLVKGCSIRESSGHTLLDDAACALITERARFRPAKDGNGRVIEASYSSSVRWLIGAGRHPEPFATTIVFTVGIDGSISDCEAEISGIRTDRADIGNRICAQYSNALEPYTDSAGNPVAKRVTLQTLVKVEAIP